MKLSTAWQKWKWRGDKGLGALISNLVGAATSVNADWTDNGNNTYTHIPGAAGQVIWGGLTGILVAGATYQVTFTVTGRANGQVRPRLVGTTTVEGTNRSSNGTFVENIVAPAAPASLRIIASTTNFDGTISAVSLIRVA